MKAIALFMITVMPVTAFCVTTKINGTVAPAIQLETVMISGTETLSNGYDRPWVARKSIKVIQGHFSASLKHPDKKPYEYYPRVTNGFFGFASTVNETKFPQTLWIENELGGASNKLSNLVVNCVTHEMSGKSENGLITFIGASQECDRKELRADFEAGFEFENLRINLDKGKFGDGALLKSVKIGGYVLDLFDNGYGRVGPLSKVVLRATANNSFPVGIYRASMVAYDSKGEISSIRVVYPTFLKTWNHPENQVTFELDAASTDRNQLDSSILTFGCDVGSAGIKDVVKLETEAQSGVKSECFAR